MLTITASRFSANDSQQTLGASFASGMINTKGIFEQQYGYFEMRAQLPTATGAWPAFWMAPDPNGNGVEADITENIAIEPNLDYVRAYAGGATAFGNVLKVGDLSGFHTYGMLWTPQTVTFFYDDQAVYQTATPASWSQPMYLIANLAVGGFGGNPDASQFPASFNIDYIRAYALADGSSVVHNLTPASMDPPPEGGGTAGDDNLQAHAGVTGIDGGPGNDTITGWSGGDVLRGGEGNDVIHGGSGFDDINGNNSDDTIDGGGSGGDWLVGGQGNDLIHGQGDFSILYGNLGNATLQGGSSSEWLRGGQGDDSISDGAGNDWLSGDRGNDTETGGPGADTFSGFSGIGADMITDFNWSEGDRIKLDPGTYFTVSQVGSDTVIDLGNGDHMGSGQCADVVPAPGWIFGF